MKRSPPQKQNEVYKANHGFMDVRVFERPTDRSIKIFTIKSMCGFITYVMKYDYVSAIGFAVDN